METNLLRVHGTRGSYARGCRCAFCRAAESEYQTAWRNKRPGQDAERARQKRRSNPEAGRAASRRYYDRHREERRHPRPEPNHGTRSKYRSGCRCDLCREAENGYRRAWLAANPDKHARYHREYLARLDNRLRNAEQCRSWHVANRERVIERQRRYFADHPEVHRANRSNRRARIRGNGGTHTAADIAAQRKRQKGVCFWRATEECQARGGKLGRRWHVDHVVPLALGGSNGPENLVIACPTCNCSKGHSHPMDWAGRML